MIFSLLLFFGLEQKESFSTRMATMLGTMRVEEVEAFPVAAVVEKKGMPAFSPSSEDTRPEGMAQKYVLFPKKDEELWAMYKKAEASFWTAEEIDLVHDRTDWETRLSENDRYFLSRVLAFFAFADGMVGENLVLRFLQEVPYMEARYFYGFQLAIENIHAEVYSLLIETYVRDLDHREELYHAVENDASVERKAKWMLDYLGDHELPFLHRLVAFACVEGIFFSGSFCAIFWVKKRGLMPGLCFSNELISRDEGLHCDFACLLVRKLWDPSVLSKERIQVIVKKAVEIEEHFIEHAIPVALVGMNAGLMKQYIRFIANRLYRSLGCSETSDAPLYPDTNPFDWMDMISLQGKTNFFEKRVGEYSKSGVLTSSTEHRSFSLQEDF